MSKTINLCITLDDLQADAALAVIAQSGLTPEQLFVYILERTAREGALPIRKTRARRKKPDAAIPGVFRQGSLFDDTPDALPDDPFEAPVRDTSLKANLITIRALQDAQAMLHWRARERRANPNSTALARKAGDPRELIETPRFKEEKTQIFNSPERPAIIAALEAAFTDLTQGRTPAGALPVQGESARLVVLGGLKTPVAFIYEGNDDDVCLVRYGTPAELLHNPQALPDTP